MSYDHDQPMPSLPAAVLAEYRLLGPLEVLRDGTPVRIGAARQRTLLAVLLVHANQLVDTDRLIDYLWDAHPPATARSTLQSLVLRLRQVLEPQRDGGRGSWCIIESRRPGYLITATNEMLDLLRFDALTAQGRQALAEGHADRAADLLRTALATDRLTVTLPAANTAADWIERRSWSRWGYPANAIRGESQYQDTIRNLPGITPGLVDDVRLEPVEVDLVRELTNRYDRFACQALVAGSLVGYLARECASVLAPLVDAAGVSSWRVAGAVVGGSHAADLYGVHIWLDRRLTVGPSWPPEP